jgi:hypothetical protein
MLQRCTWLALLVSARLCFAPDALASPNYPGILDSYSGVECPRPLTRCLICHVTAAAGEGTAKQPFAQMLIDTYDLKGKSGRALAAALDELPADRDTDGDGAPDLEELAECHNPSGEELSQGPGFGCSAAPSLRPGPLTRPRPLAGGPGRPLIFASLLLALGLVRRRAAPSALVGGRAPRG